MSDVYAVLTEIVSRELDTALPTLTEATRLDDLSGWDSVALAGVLVEIESRFGVVATRAQIDGVRTAGDLARMCGAD